VAGFQKYPLEFGALVIILSAIGIIYQNKTKPVQDENQKTTIAPEFQLVNIHSSRHSELIQPHSPSSSLCQIGSSSMTQLPIYGSSIAQLPIIGMDEQQKAYYNPEV